jgi:hypothetical protein
MGDLRDTIAGSRPVSQLAIRNEGRGMRLDATIQFMKPRRPPHPAPKKSKGATKKPSRAAPHSLELVIITGMSGSGKASVLKAFEDLGYYCVDNLPVQLIPQFADLAVQSSEIRRTALVVDVREGSKLEKLPEILKSVQRDPPPASLGHRLPRKISAQSRTPSSWRHSSRRRFRHRHFKI